VIFRQGSIADKAFDSNSIITQVNERGAKIHIGQHSRRAKSFDTDTATSKRRRLIENFFFKLKAFKRVTMRADKTDRSFSPLIYLVAAASIHDEPRQTVDSAVGRP